MPDLAFKISRAEVLPFAAVPIMAFTLDVENHPVDEVIHNILLTAQIQIETTRRRYTAAEQENLVELFAEPQRWGQTLRPLQWTHASINVRPFEGTTVFDLQVPCTFDFNVAATKYFDGLLEGEIPLIFLFSGTIFYAGPDGALQASRIPWSKEARFKLPVKAWKSMMDSYYPNCAWLSLRKDIVNKLSQYKTRHGITSWEGALENLLLRSEAASKEEVNVQ